MASITWPGSEAPTNSEVPAWRVRILRTAGRNYRGITSVDDRLGGLSLNRSRRSHGLVLSISGTARSVE